MSGVRELGIDASFIKKEHNYVTNFADMIERRVIDAQAEKDSKIIDEFVEQLEQKSGSHERIEHICIDMFPLILLAQLQRFRMAR